MKNNKTKSIKQELEEVQSLILENLYLQEKYPERKKGLELSLNSLRQLETEMFGALKTEKLNQKLEVYEMRLDGLMISNGSMPMKEYGEFLIHSQDVITSFAENKPLSLNQSPSSDIQNSTELDVFAQCSGSLRILLISKQSKLYDEYDDSLISNAFKKLNKISNYDGNFTELIKNENIGKKQVSHYKKLMKELYSKNLNLEIKKPIKDNSDELLCGIDSKTSYKLFKLIDEQQKPVENTDFVTGIIKAVDLEKHSFKIESRCGDETKIIRCDFDKKYEDFMVKNFNKEITVKLKNITEEFVDKNLYKTYELVNILS